MYVIKISIMNQLVFHLSISFLITIIILVIVYLVIYNKEDKTTETDNDKYHLITIQRPNEKPENVWLNDSISNFVVIEKSLDRETIILNHIEITKHEYKCGVRNVNIHH